MNIYKYMCVDVTIFVVKMTNSVLFGYYQSNNDFNTHCDT